MIQLVYEIALVFLPVWVVIAVIVHEKTACHAAPPGDKMCGTGEATDGATSPETVQTVHFGGRKMTAAEAIARVREIATAHNRTISLQPPSIWFRSWRSFAAETDNWRIWVDDDTRDANGTSFEAKDAAQVVGMLAEAYPVDYKDLSTQEQAELNDWLDKLPAQGAD